MCRRTPLLCQKKNEPGDGSPAHFFSGGVERQLQNEPENRPPAHFLYGDRAGGIYARDREVTPINTNGTFITEKVPHELRSFGCVPVMVQMNINRHNRASILPTLRMLDERGLAMTGDTCGSDLAKRVFFEEMYYRKIPEALTGWENVRPEMLPGDESRECLP